MTKITLLITACLVTAATVGAQITITQSTDNNTVVAGNAIACQNGFGFTGPNHHFRAYNTSNQGLFANFSVVAVRFGVENAFSLDSSGVRMTMRIYSDPTPGSLATTADLVQLAEESFVLADQSQTIVERPFACPPVFPVNGSDDIVVEIVAEDGRFVGKAFFVGSNALGESKPSFITAPTCAINVPVDMQSLQPPGGVQHNIIDLVVDSTATATSPAIYNGTCEDLNLFTGLNGGVVQDGPGADSQTIVPGDLLTLELVSQNGTFDTSGYLIFGTVFPTNLVDGTDVPELNIPNPIPGMPALDSLYVGGTTTVVVGNSSLPFGLPQFLPAGGLSVSFVHPGGALIGNSVMFQGLVVSPFGGPTPRNAFYASTNGTEVVFQ